MTQSGSKGSEENKETVPKEKEAVQESKSPAILNRVIKLTTIALSG